MLLRDYQFVHSRLTVPALQATEAIERLRHMGLQDEANQLLEDTREYTRKCRELRRALEDKWRGQT